MSRGMRGGSAALALAMTVALAPGLGAGELPIDLPPDSPRIGSAERAALLEFQRDPAANGKALLRLTAGSARDLPLVIVLAAADVHLRAGHVRAATRFFREAASRDPGPPWSAFAEFGLGWTALSRGDHAAAARHYEKVEDRGPLGAMAAIMLGWTAALAGRFEEAAVAFDGTAANDREPNVRLVATLGSGYARFWLGAYDEAALIFERVVATYPSSSLADDARYAAAWSRVKAGDEDAALPALVALAGEQTGDAATAPASDSAMALVPSSVIRAGRHKMSAISGFASPDARMVSMFDGDGSALARSALRSLARRGRVDAIEPPAEIAPAAAPPPAHWDEDSRPATQPRPALREPRPAPADPTSSSWWRAFWLVLGVLVLAMLAAMHRRGAPGSGARTR